MPEEQNYNGDIWNVQVNNFCRKVLGWQQLGTSNIDVLCGSDNEPMGFDSVFAYRAHFRSHQQIVVIEAKNRDIFKALSRGELQKWVNRLLKKVELAPSSADFSKKFFPSDDAQYTVGVLATWVRDTSSFDRAVLGDRLKQIEMPEKRNPIYLYVFENDNVTRMISVHEEIERLQSTGNYEKITFYYPANGSNLICDGTAIPLEAMFSDIMFFKCRRKQIIKSTGQYDYYDSAVCFYFGKVEASADLQFIELAIRDSGLQDVKEIEVYLISSLNAIRSEIDAHMRISKFELNFRNIHIRSNIPSWLGEL